jgi:hypothetical protein
MEWVLIAGLAAWVFALGREQTVLKRRLQALETWRRTAEAPVAEAAAPARRAKPPAADVLPAPPAEPAPAPTPVSPPPVAAAPRPARPPRPGISVAAWLSEHGLAWLGGGALALGGLFLAAYAAQRGVFTPALRVSLAIVLGLAMVGVSEVARRRLDEQRRGPAAALLAGAGAATLYGAIWAADRLYGFIDLPVSAPLLALISAGLLGLAFVHGAPLALAALFGAYLAPVVTNGPDWGDATLTAYLLLILATGYASAAFRGWKAVAWGAGAGAAIWSIANRTDGAGVHAAILLAASPAAAFAAGLWRRRREAGADLPHAMTAALLASALIGVVMWWPMGEAPVDGQPLVWAGVFWAVLVLLAAAGAGWRMSPSQVSAGIYLLAGLSLLTAMPAWPRGVDVARPVMAVVFGLVAAGLLGAVRAASGKARLYAAAAPASAAFTLTLLSAAQAPAQFPMGWSALAAAALAVGAAAAWLGRRSQAPQTDLGLAIWIWSAAVLVARAIFAGLVPEWAAPAVALLAVAFALLHLRLGWRGFGAAGGAAALAALYGLARVGALAVTEKLAVLEMSLAFVLAVAATWGAGHLVRRKDANLADGLSSGAWIMGLIGLFLLIRLRGGDPQMGLDPLLQIGLALVLLLAAGLITSRGASLAGPIGRWRQHLFLLAGLAYGVVALMLIWNPLWNRHVLPIMGPPLVDGLALAYLAPALLLALAAQKGVSARRALASLYAGGATLFALAWAALELRRLFKGPGFAWGPETIGRAEGAAYVLLVVVAALGLGFVARRARASDRFALAAGDLVLARGGWNGRCSPWGPWSSVGRPAPGGDRSAGRSTIIPRPCCCWRSMPPERGRGWSSPRGPAG